MHNPVSFLPACSGSISPSPQTSGFRAVSLQPEPHKHLYGWGRWAEGHSLISLKYALTYRNIHYIQCIYTSNSTSHASICSLQCLLSFSSFTFTCKYNATQRRVRRSSKPHLTCLPGTELAFFLVACTVLCFGSVTNTVLIAVTWLLSSSTHMASRTVSHSTPLGVGKMPGGETAKTVDPLSHNRGTAYPMTLCSAIKLDEEEGDSPKKQLLSVAGHQSACRLVSDCFCTSSPLHLFYFLLSCYYLNSLFFFSSLPPFQASSLLLVLMEAKLPASINPPWNTWQGGVSGFVMDRLTNNYFFFLSRKTKNCTSSRVVV